MKFIAAAALIGSAAAATITSSLISLSAAASATETTSASASTTTVSGPAPPDAGACISAVKYEGMYHSGYYAECLPLLADCLGKTDGMDYMWSKTSCVAAATCGGTLNLETLQRCRRASFPIADKVPNLSYNVYANIVGECAWQTGGCPITKGKYIDWFYKALSAANTSVWPQSADVVAEKFWQPIADWTATGETIPYTNFDDWLHYSNSS